MTLFEAYQLANKRRAALTVRMLPGWSIDDEAELTLRVFPRLWRGEVVVGREHRGRKLIPAVEARGFEVERDG